MKVRVAKTPRALQDLDEIGTYLAESSQSVDTAMRFFAAAENAFDLLARMPDMGSARRLSTPELVEFRMWRIRGFEKHLIFYHLIEDGIEVVRVLHSARDIAALFGETDE